MPTVNMPDGTPVAFPDDMPPEQIKTLIASKFPDQVKQVSPGFIGRVKEGFAQRDQQQQASADAYVAGEQSMPETMFQQGLSQASKLTVPIGEALASTVGKLPSFSGRPMMQDVAQEVGKLPSLSGNTLAEDIPQELASHPRLARNLTAVGQGLELATLPKGVDIAAQLGSKGLKSDVVKDLVRPADKASKPDPNVPQTIEEMGKVTPGSPNVLNADMGKISNESYDEASWLGAKFTPEQLGNKVDVELKRLKPEPLASGTLTLEDKEFINALKEFEGHTGKEITLDQLKRLDEALTAKITDKFLDKQTGAPTANGLRLQKFQQKVRQAADEAKTPGNDALINGRATWAAKRRIDDLNTIADRASRALNPESALQQGYRSLANDPDAIRGWPQEAIDALNKAATPGIGLKAMELITSKLPAMIMGGTGNLPGAATAHMVGMAGRSAKGAVIAKRGAKVQQAIVDDAMRKVRPVNIDEPKPDPMLQLSAPDKMGPRPMSDTEINISKKLAERAPGGQLPEGSKAIKPAAPQLSKLRETLGRNRSRELDNDIKLYKNGDISQNKFVQSVIDNYGLTPSQARLLVKEIKGGYAYSVVPPKPTRKPTVSDQLKEGTKNYLKDESGSISIENATGGLARQLMGKKTEGGGTPPKNKLAPKPDQVFYHGGRPLKSEGAGITFFTSSKKVAAAYEKNSDVTLGAEGDVFYRSRAKDSTVSSANLDMKNPAPTEVVIEESKKLGISKVVNESSMRPTPAMAFDKTYVDGRKIRALVNALKKRGYDGAVVKDTDPYGSPITSHVVFDRSQIKPVKGKKE